VKDLKTISTVIPTFNRETFLRKAIQSCIDQTINHEIIVCNHGGTDQTDQMIKEFDGKIRYIKKAKDNGLHFCLLEGVMEAKGEYINLLFDDDWIEPNYLEECIKYFDDSKVGFTFSQANIYNDKTQKIEKIFYNDFLKKDGVYRVGKYEFFLLKQLFSPTSFIIRKKDMIDAIYNGKLPFSKHDYKGVGPDRFMMLLCMLRYPKFGYINKPLVYFREHFNSITIDAHSDDNKNKLFEKARNEVDEYFYTLKYGKYFSFFQNKYFFKIRFILMEPKYIIKKFFSKILGI
jgi:glycosyltransferase involved in cell wall biosynthesis